MHTVPREQCYIPRTELTENFAVPRIKVGQKDSSHLNRMLILQSLNKDSFCVQLKKNHMCTFVVNVY